jgi:hypothetical protein
LQERLKGSAEGLNIDVEETGPYLRIPMLNGFHEAKSISTANLGTPQVADRLVPAPHALKKGDLRGDLAVRRAIDPALDPKHVIQILSGNNVLEHPIAILRLASRIKEIDPCCDEEGRCVEQAFLAIRLDSRLKSTGLPGYPFQRGSGHNFDLGVSGNLLNLIVHYTGKALVAFL